MSKKSNCEISYLPFHIGARTNNKEFFKLDLRDCWSIFVDHLFGLHHIFGARIHAFTLMANHYHMLACFPEVKRGECMLWFQMNLAKEINKKAKTINHVWGGPYHGSLVTNATYYSYAYKYIYRNPVEAGICKQPWDYEFSSLPGRLGLSQYEIPLCPAKPWLESLVPQELDQYFKWLDHAYPEEFEKMYKNSWIKKELRFNTRMARTLNMYDIDL